MKVKITTAGNCPKCNRYLKTVYQTQSTDHENQTHAKGKNASAIIRHLKKIHHYVFSSQEVEIEKWIHIRGTIKVIESEKI